MSLLKKLLVVLGLAGAVSAHAEDSKIVADVKASAEWISQALSSSGYKADFSLESLKEIDRFFEEHASNGEPKATGLLSQDLGARLFAIGGYIGEVIRRNQGGAWHGNDLDPNAEINVELRLPNGKAMWPIQRAMKRLKLGKEESIHAYGIAATSP
ncbi:MAG: hypothetical protein MI744_06865 [Pseudomonadales bacterium]|nr:hypothetical protein [Pseudomonadales bacterium]